MECFNYEVFLGQDINSISICGLKPNRDSVNLNNYSIFLDNPDEFNNIYGIFIVTNNHSKITQLKLRLNNLVDEHYYEELKRLYGEPNSLFIADEVMPMSKTEDKETGAILEKDFLTTRQGEFSEKPILIIWEKENYQIKVLMKYNQNLSEIFYINKEI